MFLDHVDSFGKFLKFFPTHFFFYPGYKKGPKHCFCRFLKNTVPFEYPLLKLCNFYMYRYFTFLVLVVIKTMFTKTYPGTKLRGWHHP